MEALRPNWSPQTILSCIANRLFGKTAKQPRLRSRWALEAAGDATKRTGDHLLDFSTSSLKALAVICLIVFAASTERAGDSAKSKGKKSLEKL